MSDLTYRLFNGWTITRAIYVAIGGVVLVDAVPKSEWIGMLLGGYLAAMGLFAFGCAGGNCAMPQASMDSKDGIDDVGFEEVTGKELKD